MCGVLGHLAPAHQCARSVRCFPCAVSWATWLLFTDVPARCVACVCVSSATWLLFTAVPAHCVALHVRVLGDLAPVHRCLRSVRCLCVRCPGPLGSCSPLCPRGLLCCVCGVLGHLAPVHRCACSVCCFACAVSRATWLLFTGVPARCVALRVRCPGPLGSGSLVCRRGLFYCVCGVLGHLAPVHRYARSVRCFACAVRCRPPYAEHPPYMCT